MDQHDINRPDLGSPALGIVQVPAKSQWTKSQAIEWLEDRLRDAINCGFGGCTHEDIDEVITSATKDASTT